MSPIQITNTHLQIILHQTLNQMTLPRSIRFAFGLLASFSLLSPLASAQIPLEHFEWSADLADKAAMRFFLTNGAYTVNAEGPTEEHAVPGRHTYKLDLTLDDSTGPDSFVYWIIPLPKPLPVTQGTLHADISYFIGEETTAQVDFGGTFTIGSDTKTLHTKNINIWGIDQTIKGQWQHYQHDLILAGRYTTRQVMRKHHKFLQEDDFATTMEGILIRVQRRASKNRVVLYLDEVKVEGDIPTDEVFHAFIEKRWEVIHQLHEKQWTAWESKLTSATEKVQALLDKSQNPAVTDYAQSLLSRLKTVRALIQKQRRTQTIDVGDSAKINAELGAADEMVAGLPRMEDWLKSHKDYRRYVVEPISEYQYLPSDIYPLAALGGEIRVQGARGQRLSASVVVATDIDREKLSLRVSALRGKDGREIASSHIQVRTVKSWYQSGKAWLDISQGEDRALVPELLLHDDALVRVDDDAKSNFVPLHRKDGETYEPALSGRVSKSTAMWTPTPEEYPVKDADALVPSTLSAGTSRQFWLTISIPAEAVAGDYSGQAEVLVGDQVIDTIPLTVSVLPFDLAASPLEHSIYYRGKLDAHFPEGTVSSDAKSEAQLLGDLKNMFAHGVTNPTVFQPWSGKNAETKALLDRYLELRKEAGMSNEVLYTMWNTGLPEEQLDESLADLKSKGVKEVYFYGKDEAFGPKLTAQLAEWQTIHNHGAKVFAAGTEENLVKMGKAQDLQINARNLSPELAKGWHDLGSRIFSYANPQVGAENPMLYRRNYGLRLWKAGYDGAMDYAYQHSMGNIWDDGDHPTYRDHVFAYPTANGLIDTIAWEGYYEGVTDVRYLATLEAAIHKAETSGSESARQTAKQADQWIKGLNDNDLLTGNPESFRQEIIQWILKLQR